MAFDSIGAFLAMGGYGFYVWLSFAVWLVSIAGIVAVTRWQTKRIYQQIQQSSLRDARLRAHRQRHNREAS